MAEKLGEEFTNLRSHPESNQEPSWLGEIIIQKRFADW
jgi:hypothetical protein